ncbi:MAG: cytochrome c biogenesis protein CcsA [SAR324 cluster bacterium]|nr:cytochrome c biogenesis protein CcsA [SAR324 cluster bacterium]
MFQKVIGYLALAGLALSGYIIFLWVPTESSQGYVQKIMYIHLPGVWITFVAFFITFLGSIGYLWKRQEKYDILALASAEIGVVFCTIGLVTGSIWGKPTWNTYWTWDARLTTTLILLLIFIGYLLLRKFVDPGEQQARFSAVVGIIGFLDVPLIHQSVSWWRTLHQTSTMFSRKPSSVVDPNIAMTVWISLAAMTLVFIWLLLKRLKIENEQRAFFRQVANMS